MKFEHCRGQALVELVVALPLLLVLLTTPVWFRNLLNHRLQSDSRALDNRMQNFWRGLKEDHSKAKASSCLHSFVPTPLPDATPWPQEVDQQRAITLATLRGACLAEASGRLGPKAALPLWGLHLSTPSESLAKASAAALCPRTKDWGERLRSQIVQGQRILRSAEQAKAANVQYLLKNYCTGSVNSPPMLDRIIGPILGPSPRWRFSSVGRAVD
ncbi:MAG: hypothetical protein RI953_885 [Pseudomonadota bacterium]